MSDGARTVRTLVVATVMDRTPSRIEASIERARLAGADAVEIRLDAAPGVPPEQLATMVRPGAPPLIAACRSTRDGGGFTGSEDERVQLLERAARTGRFRLDVEWGSEAETLQRERPEWVAVLSHHDREGTAAAKELEDRARSLLAASREDQIAKLVTTATSPLDLLKIRDLLRREVHPSRRLAAFAMGEAGRPSRVLASAWGSAAVWAAADPFMSGAPGQIDVASLLGLYRFRDSNPGTRVFAVAGAPVSRSLSPAIHNEAFRRLGLDAVYVPLECDSIAELEILIDGIPLDGISITAPLKIESLRLLDETDPSVLQSGACNTILVRRSAGGAPFAHSPAPASGASRLGFNTDGAALLEEVCARLDPAGREATVVGSGGAARAAAFALTGARARVTIAARSRESGERLAREVGGTFRAISALEPSPDGILIQATSAPLEDPVVPEAALRTALVIDVRYGQREGTLLASAKRVGTPVVDGLGMLVRQARAQVRMFTGRDVPLQVLFEAAEKGRRAESA